MTDPRYPPPSALKVLAELIAEQAEEIAKLRERVAVLEVRANQCQVVRDWRTWPKVPNIVADLGTAKPTTL